jgi:DNA repair protein RadC
VHPREVFRGAIRSAAAAILLVHNHPSGDPSPSAEDHAVTRRLQAAGELLGIRVVDHVIVAEGGYYSFRESDPAFEDHPG